MTRIPGEPVSEVSQLTAEDIRQRSIRWICPRWMTEAEVGEIISRGLSVEESRKVILELHKQHTDRQLIRSICQNPTMDFGDEAAPPTGNSEDDAVVRSICNPQIL